MGCLGSPSAQALKILIASMTVELTPKSWNIDVGWCNLGSGFISPIVWGAMHSAESNIGMVYAGCDYWFGLEDFPSHFLASTVTVKDMSMLRHVCET